MWELADLDNVADVSGGMNKPTLRPGCPIAVPPPGGSYCDEAVPSRWVKQLVQELQASFQGVEWGEGALYKWCLASWGNCERVVVCKEFICPTGVRRVGVWRACSCASWCCGCVFVLWLMCGVLTC